MENNPLPLGNRGVGLKLPPRNRDRPRSDGVAGQKTSALQEGRQANVGKADALVKSRRFSGEIGLGASVGRKGGCSWIVLSLAGSIGLIAYLGAT